MRFKRGHYQLNDEPNYNFQLGRVINWDGGLLEDIEPIAKRITTPREWKEELIKLGDKAVKENRTENAIAYYRMSEFFMYSGDEDKLKYYRFAKALFYDYYKDYFINKVVEKKEVPYKNSKMPVLMSKTKKEKKGTIILFGGNDSYMEELFFPMIYLSENGYDIYLFEGPGQGAMLREQNVKFTHQWEEPVQAMLDYFGLEKVVLIGISLGGMLAPRAAAFEKRVDKVVAWSVFPSFLEVLLYDFPPFVKFLYKSMLKLKLRSMFNIVLKKYMKKYPKADWGINQGMHAYGAKSPYDYLCKIAAFKMTDVAHLISQDVLILQGKDDHFINWALYKQEIDSLKNARSLTLRLFTDKEEASDHCQVGNTKLALDTILKWLESFEG